MALIDGPARPWRMHTSSYRFRIVLNKTWRPDSHRNSLPPGAHQSGFAMNLSLGTFSDERLTKSGGEVLARMIARKTVCLKHHGGDPGRRTGAANCGRDASSPIRR